MRFLLKGPRWGLRTKIIAWFFIPTALILLAVAMVTYHAYQMVTEDLVVGRNQELIRLSAAQLASDLSEHSGTLAGIARSSHISMGDPVARRVALLNARNQLAVFDAGVMILDGQGRVVAAEPDRPGILGQDWSDRAYFRQMLRNSRPAFSNIVRDGPEGTEVVVVAVPITGSQGEFRGTLAGMFRLGATAVSSFYGGIVKLRIAGRGSAYLVDASGRSIFHTNPDLVGKDLSGDEVVQRAHGGGRKDTWVGVGRGDIVASFASVPGTPWTLISEESWSVLMSSSQPYRQFLLVLLVLGVVVPALVVTVGVRRITGPLGRLTRAAQEVAAGNFGRVIAVNTGDELEELAAQFNLMSAELMESYSDLERKVADRTRELEGMLVENARLYEQAQRLAVIEERNRLARDLHDSVTQAVYGVTLYAEAAARLLSVGQVDTACGHLLELRATAQQALREMRSLIFELRPPVLEEEGLVAALQARLEAVEARAGLAAEFSVEGDVGVPREMEEELYRISQEALNNALKHARAQSIKLKLRCHECSVVLEVIDDGIGFDLAAAPEHGGMGLRGMEERAARLGGRLVVQSSPGEGTTIRVEVSS